MQIIDELLTVSLYAFPISIILVILIILCLKYNVRLSLSKTTEEKTKSILNKSIKKRDTVVNNIIKEEIRIMEKEMREQLKIGKTMASLELHFEHPICAIYYSYLSKFGNNTPGELPQEVPYIISSIEKHFNDMEVYEVERYVSNAEDWTITLVYKERTV